MSPLSGTRKLGPLPALLLAGALGLGCGNARSEGESVPSGPSLPCYGACDDRGVLRPAPLPRPECPEEPPAAGDPCGVQAGHLCSWGDSDDIGCRSVLECTAGRWAAPVPFAGLRCLIIPAADCPQQLPEQGQECLIPLGIPPRCRYPGELTCYCGEDRPYVPGTLSGFACFGPPEDPRCPARLPQLGEGCGAPAELSCVYSPFSACVPYLTSRRCSNGAWVVGDGGVCDL